MSDDEIVIPGGTDESGRPYPPFSIGDRHAVFEWSMAYTDRNPLKGAALLYNGNHNAPTLKAMDHRLDQLGATEEWRGRSYGAPTGTTGNPADRRGGPDGFCRDIAPHVLLGPLPSPPSPMEMGQDDVLRQVNLSLRFRLEIARLPIYPQTDDPAWTSNNVYRSLVARIKAREIETELVHLRDQTALPDYTLCVIDIGPVLKLALRRGGYGEAISRLIEREATAVHSAEEARDTGINPPKAAASKGQGAAEAKSRRPRRDATRPAISKALNDLDGTDEWKGAGTKERCRLVERHLDKPSLWCKVSTLKRAIIDREKNAGGQQTAHSTSLA